MTHIEAQFANIVPGEGLGRILLREDSHTPSAYGEENAPGTDFALAAPEPIEMCVERCLQEYGLPDVLEFGFLPRETAIVLVLRSENTEDVGLDTHL